MLWNLPPRAAGEGTIFTGCQFAADIGKPQGIRMGVVVILRQFFHLVHGKIPYRAAVMVHIVTLWRCCRHERDADSLFKSRKKQSFFFFSSKTLLLNSTKYCKLSIQ